MKLNEEEKNRALIVLPRKDCTGHDEAGLLTD
jgi:hypothetical protein